jgi:uncharacterized membrane protein
MLNNLSNREKIQIVYICYILGLLVFLPAIFGVILAHQVHRDTDDADWLHSHGEWLILTFWVTIVGLLMAWFASIGLIGSVLYLVCGAWTVYRIVRGGINFVANRPIVATRYVVI